MREQRLKHVFVTLIFAGVLAIAAAYASAFRARGAPSWSTWTMIGGTSLVLVATMALGAVRRSRDLRLLGWVYFWTFGVLCLGLGAAFLLPIVEAPGTRMLWGLPLRAALIVYGVGLLPLIVLPLVYAFTFDRLTLRDEDIARVRAAAAAERQKRGG